MGQEVKNPLRAQSKYGLIGSSAKTGKLFFRGSLEHFLDKNAIWDRTSPHLHINCSLHVWGRIQGSQIFKQNSIISIRSKVMAFLVILLSPRGPHRPHVVPTSSPLYPHHPCHPHIIPTSSPSSPSSSHHPHSPQKVPMWSPWSVVSVVSTCCPRCPHIVTTSSLSSPRCPCHPHIIPTSSPLSSHHPHSPQKVPMWSPWSVVSVVSSCCPCRPHVIPVIPMSSPHHLEGLHIIPNPPDTHPTHPPTPWGWGAPNR